jgi:hypothetical protein
VRQVSFTLLITGRCDSNLAQYERNRKFGHLVHALGRAAGGAKLPSVGLRLNASKAESALVMVATITRGVPRAERLEPDTAQARAHPSGGARVDRPFAVRGDTCRAWAMPCPRASPQAVDHGCTYPASGLGIVCRRLTYQAGCCTR